MRTNIMLTFGLKLWITLFKRGGCKTGACIGAMGLRAIIERFMSTGRML